MHLCDERTARGWLRRGVPVEVVASLIGCTVEVVEAIPRGGRTNYAPLPEELADKLEKVQANWTPTTRQNKEASADYGWIV